MKQFSLIFLAGIITFIYSGCCKDKKDPCKDAVETSADFTIEEVLYTRTGKPELTKQFETDLVNPKNLVRFTSKQEFDEYTWLIGSEVIKTKSFARKYFPKSSTIEVTLIGKRTPNNGCFPNDDGIDTVKKSFKTLSEDFEQDYGIWYHGYNTEDPSDTFTIALGQWNTAWMEWDSKFQNFPKGYTHKFNTYDGSNGGKHWYRFGHISDVDLIQMDCTVYFSNDRQSITIKYGYDQSRLDYMLGKRTDYEPPQIVSKTFKGTRK